MRNILIAISLLLVLAGCTKAEKKTGHFTLLENTGINFVNKVENQKDFNILTYRNFYNGGGVAAGDINNDGLPDVFFTSNMGENKLYLNRGNFQFEDITKTAGIHNAGKWGTGVVFVDINADGWLDIYVCNAGYQPGVSNENELYINQRNGKFVEAAKEFGLNESGYTTHAAFFDYDGDGDLDCYILKNSFIPVNTLGYANKRELRAEDWPVADFLKGGGDKLLRNDEGVFKDVTKEAGIFGSLIGFGLGVTVGDINGDHLPDIYISNDFFERDYLYINNGDGTFKEDLENCMRHISHSSMGADIADINNDGYPDVFTTDMLPGDDVRLKTTTQFETIDVNKLKVRSGFYNQFMQNCLQVNNGDANFSETAFYSGVAATDWSWGALMFDADNDGLTDIFVCNGIYHDVTDQDFIDFFANDIIQRMVMTGQKGQVNEVINKMPSQPVPNKFFRNTGQLKFEDLGMDWGFAKPSFSNGAAYADLDGDGDLDLIINNVNEKAFVYRNNASESTKNNFLSLQLRGGEKNPFAVGAQVKVHCGKEIISREIFPGRGFQSSVDYRVVIGIGTRQVDSLVVTWPDKTVSRITKPETNKQLLVNQSSGVKTHVAGKELAATWFKNDTTTFLLHVENEFVDFYYERNLPFMVSREGPALARADVNGDGREDIYIGGAAGEEGKLYLQTASGYKRSRQEVFKKFAPVEDVAAHFFDADSDGDVDLVIGSGGNHSNLLYEYQNRLYINDGKGNFQASPIPLPASGVNVSTILSHDVDGDGDLDLYIAARSKPRDYGLAPQHAVLINNGKGGFSELDQSKMASLNTVGMVTSAAFADMNGDGNKELVVVGDWSAPRIFSFAKGRFRELTTGLQHATGWWQTLAIGDLNGDGLNDMVLGNIGENFYLQAAPSSPVKMWVHDFDKNGTVEKIITRSVAGRDVPVFMKKDVIDQVASVRKQNLKNADFARKSIQDLFPANILREAEMLNVVKSSTVVAYNLGGGKFRMESLPVAAQLSSINAILVTDINKDGKQDLVLGGNRFDLLPQFGRLDACRGLVLLNAGNEKWQPVPAAQSGIDIRGEVKHIVPVKDDAILFVLNNDRPHLYKRNTTK